MFDCLDHPCRREPITLEKKGQHLLHWHIAQHGALVRPHCVDKTASTTKSMATYIATVLDQHAMLRKVTERGFSFLPMNLLTCLYTPKNGTQARAPVRTAEQVFQVVDLNNSTQGKAPKQQVLKAIGNYFCHMCLNRLLDNDMLQMDCSESLWQ